MSISEKPQRNKGAMTPADAKLLAFVDKGGSIATKPATLEGKGAQHPLKFPDRVLFDRLESARRAGAVTLPRNTWILQAIAEKLEREET